MTAADGPGPAGAPRLAPLADGDWDESVAELMAAWRQPGGVPNVFATLARHPALLRAWEPFAGAILLEGMIPARERELVIIRTALNCRAAYIWGSHVTGHGPEAGLSGEDVERIVAGPEAPGWSELDRALLRAADELHVEARISDEVWGMLSAGLDERQLVELPMLVGEYHLMSFTFNALGVEPEVGFPALP